MTLAEICEFARNVYGPITAMSHDPTLWTQFVNQGLDIFCDVTGCLDDTRELCLVAAEVTANATVTVDTPGSNYLAAGDVLDFITADAVEDSETIEDIVSATEITMAAVVTVSDNAEVYWEDSHGIIDLVATEPEYAIPRGVVLKQDQTEPFELYFCKTSATERKLTFTSAERLAYLYGTGWRISAGEPTHYYMRGTENFGTFPVHATALTGGLKAKWARRARPLKSDTDVPEVPRAYHWGLGYFAAAEMAAIDGRDPAIVDRLMQGFTRHHAKLASAVGTWRNQGRLVVPTSGAT